MTARKPKTCLFTVTNSCVLRCKMCHLWRLNTIDNEVSVDDCKKFIDSLCEFSGEPPEVHLIGGETLIKKGILDLIRYINGKGARTVITSSGYTIDETMAKELVESGLSMLNLSLDSLNPSVHDFLRGRDDSFEHLMRAVDYLSKFKDDRLKIGINTIISGQNLDDIIPLVEWTARNNSLDSIYFMAIMRPFGSDLGWDWFGDKEYRYLWPADYYKAEAVLTQLVNLKNRGCKIENPAAQFEAFKSYFRNPLNFVRHNRCNVSDQAININALGDAYICFFMDKIGNIKERNMDQLWNSDKADSVRRQMSSCRSNCELVVNCYYEDK